MPQGNAVQGLDNKELENQGRKSLEQALEGKRDQQSQNAESQGEAQEQQETQQSQNAQQQGETQQKQGNSGQQQQATQSKSDGDANSDSDLAEYDNVLVNTFGYSEDEITDRERKLAKSWSEIQSKATKAQQEKKQYHQKLQNVNQLFQQDESLYEHAQAVKNGETFENPSKKQDSVTEQPQSKQTGQLDPQSVDEQTLIDEGYLSKDKLNNLDDLARREMVTDAKVDFITDQKLTNFRSELEKEQQNVQKQREQQEVQRANQERLSESFDKFVRQTGVNMAELDDDTFEQIQQKALYDRDPRDPRLVADDAFEVAANRILSRKGLLDNQTSQNQQNKKQVMNDTGVDIQGQSNNQGGQKKSIADQLNERAKNNFYNTSNDPKGQFMQRQGN